MTEKLIPLEAPGEVLLEEFLKPNGIKQKTLAEAIGLPPSRVNELVKGGLRITGELAIRLSTYFGTSAEFWMNLQSFYDYEKAERETGKAIRAEVKPLALAV